MAIPTDVKEQAIYHTILSEMHRLHGVLLNMQTIQTGETEHALREHFTREQNLSLAKLMEWKQRRPDVYRAANEDFQNQVRRQDRLGAAGDA